MKDEAAWRELAQQIASGVVLMAYSKEGGWECNDCQRPGPNEWDEDILAGLSAQEYAARGVIHKPHCIVTQARKLLAEEVSHDA